MPEAHFPKKEYNYEAIENDCSCFLNLISIRSPSVFRQGFFLFRKATRD